jgi:predicted CXXCH cytochrome family protein
MKPLKIVAALIGSVVVLGLAGSTAGTLLEDNDNFCITCHTRPEVTYHDRAQQALSAVTNITNRQALLDQNLAIDLASQHYLVGTAFKCIDCHGGRRDLGDRVESLSLGVQDTLKYLLGRGDLTIEKATTGDPDLINRTCVRCHVDTLVAVRFDNHFHVKLPQTWQLIQSGAQPVADSPQALTDPRSKPELLNTTVTCLSCHQAHRSNLDFTNYLDRDGRVLPACAECHGESGHGPIGIAP